MFLVAKIFQKQVLSKLFNYLFLIFCRFGASNGNTETFIPQIIFRKAAPKLHDGYPI
jgi:hypothetical protein